jgi:hypothetical protein
MNGCAAEKKKSKNRKNRKTEIDLCNLEICRLIEA